MPALPAALPLDGVPDAAVEPSAPARKRPKPGERRVQILQTLASMLEQPGAERITTAALAAQLSVSEAALYRHFASKQALLEALVDRAMTRMLDGAERIAATHEDPRTALDALVALHVGFAVSERALIGVWIRESRSLSVDVRRREDVLLLLDILFHQIEAHDTPQADVSAGETVQ